MANIWFLSNPVTKISNYYNNMRFQEVVDDDHVSYGYLSSYDDGTIQHHYCISQTGELKEFLGGEIYEKFTNNNIFISY